MIRQAFGKESMRRTRRVQCPRDRKKETQVKSNVKRMLIIFFDIKGTVRKEFVLEGETVNSAYYCDILLQLCENVRRFRPELWRQEFWLLHYDNALSHTPFLTRKF
jgi:hypothetical protein